MKLPRRQFLNLAAGAAALPVVSGIARAQTYPIKPVRIVVGFAPGGPADISARLMGQWLSERLGQQFIIENRSGAGSNIAAEAVVHAPPDGYTLLLASAANTINATLYEKLNFNFIRDIVPVAGIIRFSNVIEVSPTFSAKTFPEFIAYAKANPGKINMASPSIGTAQYLTGELLKMATGIDVAYVPYRGSAPALTDLLGGQVQGMIDAIPASIEYIRTGKVRPLAVTAATRFDALPEIPTVSEFLPGFEASGWHGVGAPKNTPAEFVDKLNKEINAGLADPKIKAQFTNTGSTVLALSPANFGKLIAEDTEKWATAVKLSGAKPE
jgi:tripartite-type tricarboxylate transporter receptor subunit TctC